MPQSDTLRALDAWLDAADAVLAECNPATAGAPETTVPAAAGAEPPELLGKLWVRLRKERDLELHVRTGWRFGTEFVQLLDYVPSRDAYESEFLIEARLLPEISDRFIALVGHRR